MRTRAYLSSLLALVLGAALSSVAGCSASLTGPDDTDGAVAARDASARDDARAPSDDDAGPIDDLDAATDAATEGEDAAIVVGEDGGPIVVPEVDAGGPPPVDPGPDPRFEVEMTYVTANIGRDYATRADVVPVFDRVADVIGRRTGPRYIGWQEISEGDPCGDACEIEILRDRFAESAGWDTRRPTGTRPDGGTERVKVPVTSRGAVVTTARAVFASPGWSGVSPTRFVTVVHHADRNVSVLNTHFIAGAWSCRSEVARRRDYWRRAWTVLREEVAREHDRGRNVVVTGDLNRPRATDSCNPDWDPASLHARARVIGGVGIDYVFAVPAEGWSFTVSRRADDTPERGSIHLGIDGHEAHWVAGRFEMR